MHAQYYRTILETLNSDFIQTFIGYLYHKMTPIASLASLPPEIELIHLLYFIHIVPICIYSETSSSNFHVPNVFLQDPAKLFSHQTRIL